MQTSETVISAVVTSDKVRPRLGVTASGSLLTVFNEDITDQPMRVLVPSGFKEAIGPLRQSTKSNSRKLDRYGCAL